MKKIDRFLIKEILDETPASALYRALEQLPGNIEREVALKVLAPLPTGDDRAAQRFFAEVKALAQLTVHPHIVTVYSIGIAELAKNGGGIPWIALEHSSNTLAQTLTDQFAPVDAVHNLLHQISLALAAMHALTPPLLHQALRPTNILLDRVGNYKVTDFYLATGIGEDQTFSASMVRYAAPEFLSSEYGRVSPSTDLYALGHMAYELALGSRKIREQFPAVYEGNSTKDAAPNKWMQWHCSLKTDAPRLTEIRKDFPSGLSDIIARLMAKDLKARFASATEVLSALTSSHHAPLHHPATPIPLEDSIPLAAVPTLGRTPLTPARPHEAPIPLTSPTENPLPSSDFEIPVAIPTAAAAARYWVRLRGNISGPFDIAALQRMYRQGQLSRLHQVSLDRQTWQSSTTIEGLHGPTLS